MFSKLFLFEWNYHVKKWLFLLAAIAFVFFGFVFMAYGSTSSTLYKNSTFTLTFITGILSLGGIFVSTVFFSNTMLRDQEHKTFELIYTTPISKFKFILSRFLGGFLASLAAAAFATIGLLVASFMPGLDPVRMQPVYVLNYIWPFIILTLPNLLICSSILLLLGTVSKNRIAMYVGGLFIYVLYIAGSIFSSAPWVANASPASVETMSLASKLDPFGMAAVFLQTRNWSVLERNTELITLTGDLLLNRIIWILISISLLAFSYRLFSFRLKSKSSRWEKLKFWKSANTDAVIANSESKKYQPVVVNTTSLSAQWQRFLSLIKIELGTMIKGLPFLIIVLFQLLLLGSEIFSSIDGGIRTSISYPHTSIIFSNILEQVPTIGILILIFFSSEQIWRNYTLKIDELNDSSPVSNLIIFLSKYVALALLPLVLLSISIILGILIQLSLGFTKLEIGIYLSLYYYVGLPLILIAGLSLFVQSLVPSKYIGMAVTGILVVMTSTQISKAFGIRHVLLRFAAAIEGQDYSDMNGLGHYADGFHWRMLYWVSLTIVFIIITYGLWQRGKGITISHRWKLMPTQLGHVARIIIAVSGLVFLTSGSYIFYHTNILKDYRTADARLDWSQQYEEKYKMYEEIPLPTITAISSKVDLYPETHSYNVEGSYVTINKTSEPIERILIGMNPLAELQKMTIDGAKIAENDEEFHYMWYQLDQPLLPGAELKMSFEFTSKLSDFNSHSGFNAIVDNGSFIRMSRYFPFLGYTSEFEIRNKDERRGRGMPEEEGARKLEEFIAETTYVSHYKDNNFIDFETVVSTSEDQTAIAPGNLIDQWNEAERNYFHYQVDGKIPNRFAFASAKYAVKKEKYQGIDLSIYYHPDHAYNIDAMMEEIKNTLQYCQSAFGSYQYDHFRYVEISEFAAGFAATAYPGTIFNNENFGFASDLRGDSQVNILSQLIAHEFSHQWWGGQLHPKPMEGSQSLTETLAQYTEIMIYEKAYGKQKALEALNVELDLYLANRGFGEEQTLHKVVSQPHVSYSKGQRIMYLIKELVGEDKLNGALRNLLDKHAYPKTPATSLDLLTMLQEITPTTHHFLLEEWFKKVILYDVELQSGTYQRLANGRYEIELKIKTEKFEDLGLGDERKMKINEFFKVGVFQENYDLTDADNILYFEEHLFSEDTTVLRLVVDNQPTSAGIDPYILTMDKDRTDNLIELTAKE